MRGVTATIIALGFLLGMRHALDPDHVIAVGTIVTRHRTLGAGVVVGALWGLGHSLTIIIVGGAIIGFRVVIPPALAGVLELAVAVMLVVLGLGNLTAPRTRRDVDARLSALARYPFVRPIAVGLVHGLAGSAAIVLLVLTVIGNAHTAVAYLVLFGVGTIVGMTLVTLVVAAPLTFAFARLPRLHGHLRLASGMVSLGFGLFLVYHLGVEGGLFTSAAAWIAR